MSSANCIFYAKTTEGFIIKNLAELLQNNMKCGCFIINKNGISFRMSDTTDRVLIEFSLLAENFTQYKFRGQTQSMGLNLSHFYKMVKNIKKKDSIVLFIEEDREDHLGIKVIPKEKNRIITSHIKIQNLQSLDVDLPPLERYFSPKIIPSSDYMKMLKDLGSLGGENITVSSHASSTKFSSDANGVYSRNIVFGEENEDEDELLSQEFETEQLTRNSKIACLSSQIQAFQGEESPLLLKSNIGNIGKISVFIKDRTQYDDLNRED
jgi:proliferating cell nuclear antigen PCNA